MSRLVRLITHNWPLKLAAAGLATLMYGGLVLSQSAQTYTNPIQIQPKNLPADAFLLSAMPQVTSIRYFAPAGVPIANPTFIAEVDLSGVDINAGTSRVPVSVRAVDDRINILSVEPPFISVTLDPLQRLSVPVEVVTSAVPDGLELGETSIDQQTVSVFGPSSIVSKVEKARADVVIQPSGIDVDQDVALVAVDGLGNALSPVRVDPRTVHVKIPVFSDRQSRSLPVNPVVTGTPAAGFEVKSITVTPLTITVEGDADQLAALDRVDTLPISMTGASSDFGLNVGFDLPAGIVPLSDKSVRVAVTLRPVTSTRTFDAGLRLVGAKSDRTYSLSVDRVLVTIGGSVADLDRLEGASLVLDVAVADLPVGTSAAPVSATLTTGLTVVSISPATVDVTVSAPASPPPAGTGASPTPSG